MVAMDGMTKGANLSQVRAGTEGAYDEDGVVETRQMTASQFLDGDGGWVEG